MRFRSSEPPLEERAAMESKTDEIVEQRVVREVAGVVRTPEVLEKVVDALELNGFDRADIDVMADVETIRKRFGTVFVPVEEFADVPGAPRRAFVHSDDISMARATAFSVLFSIGATVAAMGVVASGGGLAAALAAAAAAGTASGGLGALATRYLRRGAGEADRDHDHGRRSRCLGARAIGGKRAAGRSDHARWRRRGGSRPRDCAGQAPERTAARRRRRRRGRGTRIRLGVPVSPREEAHVMRHMRFNRYSALALAGVLLALAPAAASAQEVALVAPDAKEVAKGYRADELKLRSVVNDKGDIIGHIATPFSAATTGRSLLS